MPKTGYKPHLVDDSTILTQQAEVMGFLNLSRQGERFPALVPEEKEPPIGIVVPASHDLANFWQTPKAFHI
jgi:hypothetical protein